MTHDRQQTPHPADKYGTPLEIERAVKSLKISKGGMGRATRKNQKDYGRPSKWSPSRVRTFSWNEINREIDKMRRK
jgi:hypothetical protein